jgi:hypothetical protein
MYEFRYILECPSLGAYAAVFILLLASKMLADTIENATTVITKSTVIVDFSMSLSSILHSQDVHDDDNDDGSSKNYYVFGYDLY